MRSMTTLDASSRPSSSAWIAASAADRSSTSAAARSGAAPPPAGALARRAARRLVFFSPPLHTPLPPDAPLFDALIAIDHELATPAQAGGCRRCAGRLDHADYPRKP